MEPIGRPDRQFSKPLSYIPDFLSTLITDIQMPGDMDGIDLAYSVKNSFSALPIIVISGGMEIAPWGLSVVRKPFVPGVILEAVDKALLPSTSETRH